MLRMARVAERGGGKGVLRAETGAMLGRRLVLNQEIRKAGRGLNRQGAKYAKGWTPRGELV